MTQRQANINRTILETLRDYGTATLDEIAGNPAWRLLRPARDELARGLRSLLVYGYVKEPIAGDADFVGITESGLRQVNREGAKLDPAIWGREAAGA